jgi:hypothetical protein
MKENNFYIDEFEQLIREKTEQYKMYPSEKVWKGIHGSLHTKRKWFIGSMSLLVSGILIFAGKELIAPANHPVGVKKIAATGAVETGLSKAAPENTTPAPFSSLRIGTSSPVTTRRPEQTTGLSSDPDNQTYAGITITISNLVISQPDLSEFLSHTGKLPTEVPSLPVIAVKGEMDGGPAKEGMDGVLAKNGSDGATGRSGTEGTTSRGPADGISADNEKESTENSSGQLDSRTTRSNRGNRKALNNLARTGPGQEPIVLSGDLPDASGEMAKTSPAAMAEASDQQRINWLQDYAVYHLPASPKRGRTYLQLSLSPTVNYRTLSGGDFSNPKSNVQNIPVALLHPGDAQQYVDHSPALGFSVGGSLLYKITRNLTLKGGLQFNFSRYKIEAYASSPQQATISLNSYYGYYMDSITSTTNIRNFGGKTPETLSNDYYQLSAPIGFEFRILGNERLQVNVGATIQPSYLLNTNSYMLTSDYTNYTKEPSLFRRWNVNGGLEAFLSYRMGDVRWQIGPEFRYQLLSTYNNQYPIHENLKGYGLKIGITKAIP